MLSKRYESTDKCIHTKYMCLNQWTMMGMVPVLYNHVVRSTNARDTLSKFFGRQA